MLYSLEFLCEVKVGVGLKGVVVFDIVVGRFRFIILIRILVGVVVIMRFVWLVGILGR